MQVCTGHTLEICCVSLHLYSGQAAQALSCPAGPFYKSLASVGLTYLRDHDFQEAACLELFKAFACLMWTCVVLSWVPYVSVFFSSG